MYQVHGFVEVRVPIQHVNGGGRFVGIHKFLEGNWKRRFFFFITHKLWEFRRVFYSSDVLIRWYRRTADWSDDAIKIFITDSISTWKRLFHSFDFYPNIFTNWI